MSHALNPRTVARGLCCVAALACLGSGVIACERSTHNGQQSSSSASASNTTAPEQTASEESATHREPRANPQTGKVRGIITINGDAPPVIDSIAPKIPVGKCFRAHDTYAKLFRRGAQGTLADVLVAVTEYPGDAAAPSEKVIVEAEDCAYDTRTIALSLGQTLSIRNVGKQTATPQLVGHSSPALLLAIPGGDPVEFVPKKLGQYQLVDRTHSFVFTDVFVLNYSTVDVTGLDGQYEIGGLPAGKAKLSALLPITGQSIEKTIEVEAGKAKEVNVEFEFDAERDGQKARALPGH